MGIIDEVLSHVSEKPWSDYKESDYSLEQWHAACLIHQHTGPPTSKSQCKLPVKTPNGALSRAGVIAAAAALAGARGGVNATTDEKAQAARALLRYYSQLNEKPPPSITAMAHADTVSEFLKHYGIKGMHWGIRRSQAEREAASPDAARAHEARTRIKTSGTDALSNQELQHLVTRMNLEQQYSRLSTEKSTVQKGNSKVKQILQLATTVQQVHAFVNSPLGASLKLAFKKH